MSSIDEGSLLTWLAVSLLFFSSAPAVGLFPTPLAAQAQGPVGTWEGVLDTGAAELTIVFNIERAEDGSLTATMDSPDQGATGIAVSRVTFADGELHLESGAVGGEFQGTLSEDGTTLQGTWRQGGGELPLTLSRTERAEVQTEPSGPDDPVGTWQGVLDAGPQELTLVFHVRRRNGELRATMDSPDQGARGIPVNEASFSGGTLRLVSQAVAGRFEGRLSDDGTSLDGTWRQGGGELPLTLERVDEVEERPRPQEPEPPFPYRVEEVSFPNEDAGIELAGTLTLPEGDGPFPAVALVTGSGPQNRNEELMGHKPFLVLADHLTRAGIAVLRYDDRGVGESEGEFGAATSEDFAGDALAAIAYLESLDEVARERTGLLGHSEGGLVAPMAANRSDAVDFVVMLAGTGLTGQEILHLQGRLIAEANGAAPEAIDMNQEVQRKIFAALREEETLEAARERMRRVLEEAVSEMTPEQRAAAGIGGDAEQWKERQIEQVTSPWFRFFLTYDPVPALERLDVPVLAVNGGKDLQVPPDENLSTIRAALERGGNPDYTVNELPGLNHLFQEADSGSPLEYAKIEQTMSPTLLNLVSSWILERFGPS